MGVRATVGDFDSLQGLERSLLNRIGTIRRSGQVVQRFDPTRLVAHPVSVRDIRPTNNDPGVLEPINNPKESGKACEQAGPKWAHNPTHSIPEHLQTLFR